MNRKTNRNNSRRTNYGLMTVGKTIPKITERAMAKRGFMQSRLITEWPMIVGERISEQTVPQKLVFARGYRKDAILHLRVASGFALELQHIAPQVVERINSFFGYSAISTLKYLQGPISTKAQHRRIVSTRLSVREERLLESDLLAINDPGLHRALLKLGRSVRQFEQKTRSTNHS